MCAKQWCYLSCLNSLSCLVSTPTGGPCSTVTVLMTFNGIISVVAMATGWPSCARFKNEFSMCRFRLTGTTNTSVFCIQVGTRYQSRLTMWCDDVSRNKTCIAWLTTRIYKDVGMYDWKVTLDGQWPHWHTHWFHLRVVTWETCVIEAQNFRTE